MAALLSRIFRNTKYEDKSVANALQLRAWLLHLIYDVQRVISWVTGISTWPKAECDTETQYDSDSSEDKCAGYNKDLLDQVVPAVQFLIGASIVIGLILDILCYKYRHLTNILLPLQSWVTLLYPLVPNSILSDKRAFFMVAIYLLMFTAFSNGTGLQIIVQTLSLTVYMFVVLPVSLSDGLDAMTIAQHLIALILFFVACTCLTMLVHYIEMLHAKKTRSMLASNELIHNMHEGLLILHKASNKVMFCNFAAYKLVHTFLGTVPAENPTSEKQPQMMALCLQAKAFQPIKVAVKKEADSKIQDKITSHTTGRQQPITLEQIILLQQDEPKQKSCIYKLQREGQARRHSKSDQGRQKHSQIRVKSIEFLEEQATAIYFYDVSHHMESLEIEHAVTKQNQRNMHLKNDSITDSNALRKPLQSCLMLLDSMLNGQEITSQLRTTIWLVITQINQLLCLVNDQFDLRMIELGQFKKHHVIFKPKETFESILNIMTPQAKILMSQIKFAPVDWLIMPGNKEYKKTQPVYKALPDELYGDNIRLKQVLINLLRNSIKFAMGKAIEIRACFSNTKNQLQVHIVDQGAGISPLLQSKLKAMLETPAHITTNSLKGKKTGLFICKSILERYGGSLSFLSAGEGQGTTFIFSMSMSVLKTQNWNQLIEEEAKHDIEMLGMADGEELDSSTAKLHQKETLNKKHDQQILAEDGHNKLKQIRHARSARNLNPAMPLCEHSSQLQSSGQQQNAANVSCASDDLSLELDDLQNLRPAIARRGGSDERIPSINAMSNISVQDIFLNQEEVQDIEALIITESSLEKPGSKKANALSSPEQAQGQEPLLIQGYSWTNKEQTKNPQSQTRPQRQVADASQSNRPKVLIVDSDYYSAFASRSMLERFPIDITLAHDGKIAIDLVKDLAWQNQKIYSMILMDIRLPVCDGLETTKAIRSFISQETPHLKQPFICCLTSYVDQAIKQLVFDAQIDAYLTKNTFKSGIRGVLVQAGLVKDQ